MAYYIKCLNQECGKVSQASNIVDLLDNKTDSEGFFLCDHCKSRGYIEKTFQLQEADTTWNPFLKGAIKLGALDDTYQPFVYLVSYKKDTSPEDFWFCYYKDTRGQENGKLKLGHGPGGPPVLNKQDVLKLLDKLLSLGIITREDLSAIVPDIKK
jgi:hypothetical protein